MNDGAEKPEDGAPKPLLGPGPDAPPRPPESGVATALPTVRGGLSSVVGLALVTCISLVGWWITVITGPSPYVHPIGLDMNGMHVCQWLAFLLGTANVVALVIAVRSRYAKHVPSAPKNRDNFIWGLIGSIYAILLTVGNAALALMLITLLDHRSGGGVPQATLFGLWLSGAATMLLLDVLAWRIIKRGREGRPVDGAPVTRGWVELKGNYRAGRLERFEGGQRMPPVPLKLKVTWGAKGLSLNDGDEIVVAGRWKAQRILRVKRLYNATTGARFG